VLNANPLPSAVSAAVPRPELAQRDDRITVCQGQQIFVVGDQIPRHSITMSPVLGLYVGTHAECDAIDTETVELEH